MNQSIDLDSPSMTAYVLGELEGTDFEEFETKLRDSEIAAKELEATEEMIALLSESLEVEWKTELTPSVDDPGMTDYALGELDGVDLERVEAELRCSNLAANELDATQDMVALLSESLEAEWKAELNPEPEFVVVEKAEEDGKVVRVDFAPASQNLEHSAKRRKQPSYLSVAAVFAALLVVGAMFVNFNGASQTPALVATETFTWEDAATEVPRALTPVEKEPAFTPSLLLVEELTQPIESLQLAGLDRRDLDSSYFGRGSKVNASFHADMSNADTSHLFRGGLDRVDSYLPPSRQIVHRMSDYESDLDMVLPHQGILAMEDEFEMGLVIQPSLSSFQEATPSIDISAEYQSILDELETIVSGVNGAENDVRALENRLKQLLEQHRNSR